MDIKEFLFRNSIVFPYQNCPNVSYRISKRNKSSLLPSSTLGHKKCLGHKVLYFFCSSEYNLVFLGKLSLPNQRYYPFQPRSLLEQVFGLSGNLVVLTSDYI